MNLHQLIEKYTNINDKERKIGRYYASELYGIIAGYKKPEDFFKKEKIPSQNARMIQEGNAIEDRLSTIFKEMKVPCEDQIKKEIKIDDMVIVVKTDYVFKKFIAELKRPRELSLSIPDKWKYQLEATYRAFKKPVKLWQVYYPMSFLELDYKPSDKIWFQIKQTLQQYHKEVVKVAKTLKTP